MKRMMVVASLVLLVLGSSAGISAAQERDPFDPLLEESSGGGAGVVGTDVQPQPQPPIVENGTDAFPNTGAEPLPYLALAYALIAIGAGTFALGRLWAPVAARR